MGEFKVSNVGLGLAITTFLLMVFMVLFHYFVVNKNKKVHKIFHSYFYWMPIAAFCLIYFIIGRWSIKITEFFQSDISKSDLGYNVETSSGIYKYSTLYSGAFLLDLCPAVAVVLPFSLIIDKTRTLAKCIAPYAIIGSVLSIFTTTLTQEVDSDVNMWVYIFFGQGDNQMFFMMHFMSLLLAIGVLLTSKNFTRYSVLGSFSFICLYIAYVKIFVDIKGVSYNTTGVSEFDWYDEKWGNYSEYHNVYAILNLPFPALQIVSYFSAVFVQFLFQFIKNITTKDENKMLSIDNFWYVKYPFLSRYLYSYDKKINDFFYNIKTLIIQKHK